MDSELKQTKIPRIGSSLPVLSPGEAIFNKFERIWYIGMKNGKTITLTEEAFKKRHAIPATDEELKLLIDRFFDQNNMRSASVKHRVWYLINNVLGEADVESSKAF